MSQPANNSKTWNLDDIVGIDEFQDLLERAYKDIDNLAEFFNSRVTPGMTEPEFVEFSNLSETTTELLHRLSARAELMILTNQKDALAIKLKNQSKDLEIYYSEKMQPVSLWLQGKNIDGKESLDDSNSERLFASVPDLQYILEYDRKLAHYSLSAKEENIISAKDSNGTAVLYDLRGVIESEMKFRFQPKGQDTIVIESLTEINSLKYSLDAHTRAEAFRASFEQYSNNIDKFFMIYQAIAKDWSYTAKLRGYPSPISMRNAENHVSDIAIETLMRVCIENNSIFQRFFKYKAKLLGMNKLRRFDIYTPIGEDILTIDYDKAINLVLETFEEFSPNFAAKAKSIIEANHIDSQPGDSKSGGASCWTITPKIVPYIMLNYTSKGKDIGSIAHELGHGIHSLYASVHSVSTQESTLPLGETAATLCETIVFEKLLEKATNNDQKKYLLASKITECFASIMRQNYFVKFEIEAHQKLQEGITESELSGIWLDNLHQQFGGSVEVDDMFAHEWAVVPHIFERPFYCYAYNFGELLSLALYKRYKDEGDSFVPKIEQVLTAGSSQSPEIILQDIGIDINSAQFWQASFEIIEDWQKQLEAL